jgi:subtilase family serine protease
VVKYNVGFIAAGVSKTITVTGLAAGTAGNKTASAYVDSWCEIVESNETNNQMIKAYTVQ